MRSPDADTPADARPLVHALVEVGHWLQSCGYAFTTVTPATHERVVARPRPDPDAPATPEDIFGWNRPYRDTTLPPRVLRELRERGLCQVRSSHVHITDLRSLTQMALFDPQYLYLQPTIERRATGREEPPHG